MHRRAQLERNAAWAVSPQWGIPRAMRRGEDSSRSSMLPGRHQMKLRRVGSAMWAGDLKEGKGTISTRSRALSNYPYGLESRLDGVRGTNPEELLAAAHASCFTMGLVMMLERIGK